MRQPGAKCQVCFLGTRRGGRDLLDVWTGSKVVPYEVRGQGKGRSSGKGGAECCVASAGLCMVEKTCK